MIAEQNTFQYSYEYPDGKLFLAGEEIPDEFVDSPDKLGINRLDTKDEVRKKCEAGIQSVKKIEGSSLGKTTELDLLRTEYEQKFGKKPHHLKKIDKLREELAS